MHFWPVFHSHPFDPENTQKTRFYCQFIVSGFPSETRKIGAPGVTPEAPSL
jgi:hypothetical protein